MRKSIIPLLLVLVAAISFAASDQLFKTDLKITVLDDLGNIQEGATVRLFLTEKEFKAEENAIESKEKGTDEKGVIWFKNVEAKSYYVLAENGDKNNWGGGVKTGLLKSKKVNKVNIIID